MWETTDRPLGGYQGQEVYTSSVPPPHGFWSVVTPRGRDPVQSAFPSTAGHPEAIKQSCPGQQPASCLLPVQEQLVPGVLPPNSWGNPRQLP